MSSAIAGLDYCEYCSVVPRHPCHSEAEARNCPNSSSYDPETDREKIERLTREAAELSDYKAQFDLLLDDYEKEISRYSIARKGLEIIASNASELSGWWSAEVARNALKEMDSIKDSSR